MGEPYNMMCAPVPLTVSSHLLIGNLLSISVQNVMHKRIPERTLKFPIAIIVRALPRTTNNHATSEMSVLMVPCRVMS